jgi:hypothetical protein
MFIEPSVKIVNYNYNRSIATMVLIVNYNHNMPIAQATVAMLVSYNHYMFIMQATPDNNDIYDLIRRVVS